MHLLMIETFWALFPMARIGMVTARTAVLTTEVPACALEVQQ